MVLGFLVDLPFVSLIAICKSPYMLFKGWHRLFHDLIGREGPFLETICVPFAGLAILLWPLAVIGAVLGSMVSSIFLGAYAGVVVYQVNLFAQVRFSWSFVTQRLPVEEYFFFFLFLVPFHVSRASYIAAFGNLSCNWFSTISSIY